MHNSFPFLLIGLVSLIGAAACGGVADLGGSTYEASNPDGGAGAGPNGGSDGAGPEVATDGGGGIDAGACSLNQYKDLVVSGGTLTPRPAGSVLRLVAVYQGSRVAIIQRTGTTMVLPDSDGPFSPGVKAGYWYELRDGADAPLYTQLLRDPTHMETVAAEGGFAQGLVPYCEEKSFMVDVPNDPAGTSIVIFGSPYGTSNAAGELARFHLP